MQNSHIRMMCASHSAKGLVEHDELIRRDDGDGGADADGDVRWAQCAGDADGDLVSGVGNDTDTKNGQDDGHDDADERMQFPNPAVPCVSWCACRVAHRSLRFFLRQYGDSSVPNSAVPPTRSGSEV